MSQAMKCYLCWRRRKVMCDLTRMASFNLRLFALRWICLIRGSCCLKKRWQDNIVTVANGCNDLAKEVKLHTKH